MVFTTYQGLNSMWNRNVDQGPVPPPWVEFTKAEEKQRLVVLQERIERKAATIEELLTERRRIMRRAIARMRRAEGKE